MKSFVGDYRPDSLTSHLEVTASRAFIEVFGEVKVTICLSQGESDTSELSKICHMISAMPFVPSKDTARVFQTVFCPNNDQFSDGTKKFLEYIEVADFYQFQS